MEKAIEKTNQEAAVMTAKNLSKEISFEIEGATFTDRETGEVVPYDKVLMFIRGVKVTVKASNAADSHLLTYFLNDMKNRSENTVNLRVEDDSFVNEETQEEIPFKRVVLTINGQDFAIKASKKDKNLLLYFVNELTR